MTSQQPFNLEALGERYEIIGELAGRDDARTFIAKRRPDGADVLVAVVQSPPGDEGNALSHLAADTNLLSGLSHPNLLPVLEGTWVGTDAFAVITPRVYAPTLEELLARRDEEFPYPRIAVILREVNGALEWARARKIVHRATRLNTIFLEPGTDRVLLSFTARALPLTDMPGAEEDARAIATLARAMLTRSAAAPERASAPLAELRPGLPASVLAQTETLLQLTRASDVPDVTGYIASIAMADALKTGDEHLEHTRNAVEVQRREHQAQLEKERDDFGRHLAKEQETLAKERAALAKERASHERDRLTLQSEREAHEREIAQVREQLEWESAALATQAERYGKIAELPTPVQDGRPLLVPEPARRPSRRKDWLARAWRTRPTWNRGWNKPAAAVALVLLMALSAVAIGRGRNASPERNTASQAVRVVDSVAGGVVQPVSLPGADSLSRESVDPGVPADLLSSVTARANPDAQPVSLAAGVPADLLAGVQARAASTPVQPWRAPQPPREQFAPRPEQPAPGASGDTTRRLDTIFTAPVLPVRADSVVRRDSIARPRPDSVVRDSLPRDTIPRRDSTRAGRS